MTDEAALTLTYSAVFVQYNFVFGFIAGVFVTTLWILVSQIAAERLFIAAKSLFVENRND